MSIAQRSVNSVMFDGEASDGMNHLSYFVGKVLPVVAQRNPGIQVETIADETLLLALAMCDRLDRHYAEQKAVTESAPAPFSGVVNFDDGINF
jgi:hypothetical protein